MAIKMKAIERNVSFQKGVEKYAYVLQTEIYNRLTANKVIQEAAIRSGVQEALLNVAWVAIGAVIKAWATEGHSVAVPGLGTMRFGVRAASVANVNDVSTNLITARRVIFVPSTDIKQELKNTNINITCYNRDGEVVKQVTSADDAEVEDNENGNGNGNGNENVTDGGTSTTGGSEDNPGSGLG